MAQALAKAIKLSVGMRLIHHFTYFTRFTSLPKQVLVLIKQLSISAKAVNIYTKVSGDLLVSSVLLDEYSFFR
jgi:hypothetical protein